MKFDREVVHFNIFYEIKYFINSHSMFTIYAINPTVQEFFEFNFK